MNSIDIEIHSAVAGSGSCEYVAKKAIDSIRINDHLYDILIFDFMDVGRNIWDEFFQNAMTESDIDYHEFDIRKTFCNSEPIKMIAVLKSLFSQHYKPDIIILSGLPSESMDVVLSILNMKDTLVENNVKKVFITNQLSARLKEGKSIISKYLHPATERGFDYNGIDYFVDEICESILSEGSRNIRIVDFYQISLSHWENKIKSKLNNDELFSELEFQIYSPAPTDTETLPGILTLETGILSECYWTGDHSDIIVVYGIPLRAHQIVNSIVYSEKAFIEKGVKKIVIYEK